jgi:hypothetical protein
MKKLLLIFTVLALTVISSCVKTIPGPDKVDVFISLEMKSPIVVSSQRTAAARTDASLYGFENQFSGINITAHNTATGDSYSFDWNDKIVGLISVPEGTYNIFISGNGDDIYGQTLEFSGNVNDAVVVSGGNISIICETSHALLILDKNIPDDIPTIGVWGSGSENYPPINMFEQAGCYYIYVYGSWGYEVIYNLNGQTVVIRNSYESSNMYDLGYASVGISVVLPF